MIEKGKIKTLNLGNIKEILIGAKENTWQGVGLVVDIGTLQVTTPCQHVTFHHVDMISCMRHMGQNHSRMTRVPRLDNSREKRKD